MYVNPLYFGIAIGVGSTVLIEVAFIICVAVLQSKSK